MTDTTPIVKQIVQYLSASGVDITVEELFELQVLVRGGVSLDDFRFSDQALDRAIERNGGVSSLWGYLRTVALVHRAEKNRIKREAERESGEF